VTCPPLSGEPGLLRVGGAPTLDERDEVQSAIELTVAATAQPVSVRLTRGGKERRGSGHHREGGLGADPGDLSHLTEDLGRDERTHSRDLGERGPRPLDRSVDLLACLGDASIESSDLGETSAKELDSQRVVAPDQAPRLGQLPFAEQLRDRPLVTGSRKPRNHASTSGLMGSIRSSANESRAFWSA
jgi:hypothetical protein